VKFLALIVVVLMIQLAMISPAALAGVYSYTERNTVVAWAQIYIVKDDESLIEIARKFDLGYHEIADANSGIDPFVPGEGMSVQIPTSWILPDVKQYEGIIINLSEMRLFYFIKRGGSKLVMTFPIGIGREGFRTPLGRFSVVEKIVNPEWHVPKSIRKEKPELPDVVPAGPDNPLGSHALRLSEGTILIHGTNKPWGVGRRVSHGCIRLYPEDISILFRSVRNGTKVTIVRQPVKIGERGGRVFLEVSNDGDAKNMNYFDSAISLLRKKNLLKDISSEKLCEALRKKRGIPVDISNK
jgi:L,D-transpeptidase ErfK/SrfK